MFYKKAKIALYCLFGIAAVILFLQLLVLLKEIRTSEYLYENPFTDNSEIFQSVSLYFIGIFIFFVGSSLFSIVFLTSLKSLKSGPLTSTNMGSINTLEKRFFLFFIIGMIRPYIIRMSLSDWFKFVIPRGMFNAFYPKIMDCFPIPRFLIFTIPMVGYFGILQAQKIKQLRRRSSMPWLAGIFSLSCIVLMISLEISGIYGYLTNIIGVVFLGFESMILLMYGYWGNLLRPKENGSDIVKENSVDKSQNFIEKLSTDLLKRFRRLKYRLTLKNVGLCAVSGFYIYFVFVLTTNELMFWVDYWYGIVMIVWLVLFIIYLIGGISLASINCRLIMYGIMAVLNIIHGIIFPWFSFFGGLQIGMVFIGFGMMLHFSEIYEIDREKMDTTLN